MANYYDVLGVSKNASEKEIRQAYRRLARQYHPDVNKDDVAAEENFKEINEAYSVLSDEESRRKFDLYGENWRQAREHGSGAGAVLLAELTGGPLAPTNSTVFSAISASEEEILSMDLKGETSDLKTRSTLVGVSPVACLWNILLK